MGAKSPPPGDKREYVRISVDIGLNPKLASLDNPAAGWLSVIAITYCGQNLTDGEFIPAVVYRLAGVDSTLGRDLIEVGLWHEPGHDCPTCPQPGDRKLIVHDYLQHQRSKEEAQALRSARSDAGAKGAEKRWAAKRAADLAKATAEADAMASAMASAIANGWQADGKAMAEVEVEEEKEQPLLVPDPVAATPSISSAPAAAATDQKKRPKAEPERPDVEYLCNLLAELMTANGVRKPSITTTWRREARLLLDRDGIDPRLAEHVLRWSQADTFWKTNILSMPTFREKFDQLRLKRREEHERAQAVRTERETHHVDRAAPKNVPPPQRDPVAEAIAANQKEAS